MNEQEHTMNSAADDMAGPQPAPDVRASGEEGGFEHNQTFERSEPSPKDRPIQAAVQFHFNGERVRTVVKDGETWFVAADVCAVLGYNDTTSAVSRLDDDERGLANVRTLGGDQQMVSVW